MSFDIFLQFCADGTSVSRPRTLIAAAAEAHGGTWTEQYDLLFPDDSVASTYCGDDPEIDSVMFNHFGGKCFFDFLFELMRSSDAVLFWPASSTSWVSVVAQPHVAKALPADMAAEIGTPYVITSGDEIRSAIENLE